MHAVAQATHYRRTRELFVLPECLYGKYRQCKDSLFKHYVGSTWHSDDAAFMKGIFHHRLELGSLVLLVVGGGVVLAMLRSWRALRAAQVKGH